MSSDKYTTGHETYRKNYSQKTRETIDPAVKPELFRLPFGKHKGQTLGSIADSNPAYLNWLYSQPDTWPATKHYIEEVLLARYSRNQSK